MDRLVRIEPYALYRQLALIECLEGNERGTLPNGIALNATFVIRTRSKVFEGVLLSRVCPVEHACGASLDNRTLCRHDDGLPSNSLVRSLVAAAQNNVRREQLQEIDRAVQNPRRRKHDAAHRDFWKSFPKPVTALLRCHLLLLLQRF